MSVRSSKLQVVSLLKVSVDKCVWDECYAGAMTGYGVCQKRKIIVLPSPFRQES